MSPHILGACLSTDRWMDGQSEVRSILKWRNLVLIEGTSFFSRSSSSPSFPLRSSIPNVQVVQLTTFEFDMVYQDFRSSPFCHYSWSLPLWLSVQSSVLNLIKAKFVCVPGKVVCQWVHMYYGGEGCDCNGMQLNCRPGAPPHLVPKLARLSQTSSLGLLLLLCFLV